MKKITVFHPQLQVNGGYTVFEGDDVTFQTDTDGTLIIQNWTSASEKGNAIFAPGQWGYVCTSSPKEGKP